MKQFFYILALSWLCSCASSDANSGPKSLAAQAESGTSSVEVAPEPPLDIPSYFENPKEKASTIRRNFYRDYQKIRREHNRERAKKRKEFSRQEKSERRIFVKEQKEKRKRFLEGQPDKDATKDFFSELDVQRKDFFSEQKDKRKDVESERRQEKKDFDAFMKDKKKEFDDTMKNFAKVERERKKEMAAGLRSSALQKKRGQGKRKGNPQISKEDQKYIDDFNRIPKGKGIPLNAGEK